MFCIKFCICHTKHSNKHFNLTCFQYVLANIEMDNFELLKLCQLIQRMFHLTGISKYHFSMDERPTTTYNCALKANFGNNFLCD